MSASSNNSHAPRIGVDLGGTKIEAVVLEPDGAIRVRQRTATPRDDYHGLIEALAQLLDDIETAAGMSGSNLPIGIGTPGAISRVTGRMKNCNTTCLNDMPLMEDLEARLDRSVRIANDADCFALSEAVDGAGAGARSVFGVILGTGVGGGLCYERRLLQGANAICGEWGHTTLPLNGYQPGSGSSAQSPAAGYRLCYCGRFDCVESWLAGPAFERSYADMTGDSLTAPDIVALASRGDERAKALVDQYANLLALALSTVINIVDPDVIVLGGGMSNTDALYTLVPNYLPHYVFSDRVDTRIVRAAHGDSSGVRGAAWLWE